ncbi:MAG TPA: hypothetical protein VE263_10875, partial [Candidatus Angelobacter sp.]|nr:hypothetical protein [Candidatus Angelobacter sp.]
AEAELELQRVFSPGVRFLIRQRLGRRDVEGEARSVWKTVVRLIQTDGALRAETLPRVVRTCIQQSFPFEARPKGPAAAASSRANVEQAAGILSGMPEVEREALREYYVRGKAPDSFLKRLHLTLREFRAIQTKARAAFSAMQKENVA